MPRYLSVREAAAYTGIGKSTLDRWRAVGTGPEFIWRSDHRVAYAIEDIDNYMAARRRKPSAVAQTVAA